MREGRKDDSVAVGKDGGLLRLRWPEGRREVAETADLLLDGGGCRVLGPSTSKVRFPSVSGDAAALT